VAGQKQSISAEGKAKAEEELRQRREVRRPEIVKAIKVAREFGDLKENAEYHAAREEQGLNEARIRVLEHHLASAEVDEGPGDDTAAVGSRVRYRDLATDKDNEVTLVHPLETMVAEGKVSIESPIGKALLGTRVGERVELNTTRGDKQLEVLEIG
jgi:transcription elongation factor GreA